MICWGSSSDIRKIYVSDPNPDPDHIEHSFPKNFLQNIVFPMLEAVLFAGKLTSQI